MKIKVKVLNVHIYDKEKGEMEVIEHLSEKAMTFKELSKELDLTENERVVDVKKTTEEIIIDRELLKQIRNEQKGE